MDPQYQPKTLEPAVQKAWAETKAFVAAEGGPKPKHQLRKVVLLVASGDVYKEGDPRDGLMPMITGLFGFIGVTDIENIIAKVARNLAQVGLLSLLVMGPILLLSGLWTPPEAMPTWMRWG